MQKTISHGRLLAIAAGIAATGAALAILCQDALATGNWTLEHAILPVLVSVTILSGHLVGTALRAWKIGSAAGFALLFAVGTALTVYVSVGKQAAKADTEVLALEATNEEIARLKTDAQSIRQTLTWAVPDARAECKGAPNPLPASGWPECKRKQSSVEAFNEKLARTEKRLGELGAPKPVAPRADRAAEVAAVLFGADKGKVKRTFQTFEPIAFSLFFELMSIVAFGFAFGHRRKAKPVRTEITPEPGPVVTATPATATSALRRAEVHSFVAAHRARHGRLPQIAQVQRMHLERFGAKLPKSSAARWRTEAASVEPVRRLRVVG